MVITPFKAAGESVGWEGPRNVPVPALSFSKELYSKLIEHKYNEDDLKTIIRYHRFSRLPENPVEVESEAILEQAYLWVEGNLDDERRFVPSKEIHLKRAGIGYHNYPLA
jgi:hypothetical protein